MTAPAFNTAWHQHGQLVFAAGASPRCAARDPCRVSANWARRYGREPAAGTAPLSQPPEGMQGSGRPALSRLGLTA